jgi:thiamine biosynthesis protein ThiS
LLLVNLLRACLNPGKSEQNAVMPQQFVIANGREVFAKLPCTLEQFLMAQELLPRSVVVEHNGEAVAPSEFPGRELKAGDRLEIVKIVAGG